MQLGFGAKVNKKTTKTEAVSRVYLQNTSRHLDPPAVHLFVDFKVAELRSSRRSFYLSLPFPIKLE